MQKRILGYFDGLATAKTTSAPANTATANVHTAKTNKVQSASQTEKTSVSGFYKARKIAVVLMLLVFSVFCAIGSADWIISQQVKIEGGTTSPGETPSQPAFVLDQSALQAHIEIAAGKTEATVPSKARANSPSDAASAAPSSYSTTNATATPNAVNAASNASNAPTSAANSASNKTFSEYNGTALTVNLKNQPQNAAKKLVDNDSTVQFTTKYITWDGTASLTPNDFTSANAATDGMPTNAGKYAIYVQLVGYTGENGASNLGYAIKYHEITPRHVAITWGDIPELTYNGKDQSSSIKPTANILEADKDKVTVSFTPNEIINAGDYTLTASLTGEKARNYYISAGETTKVTVNKAIETWNINPTVKPVDSSGNFYTDGRIIMNDNYVGYCETKNLKATVTNGQIAVMFATTENGTYSQTQPKTSGTYYAKFYLAESENYKSLETIITYTITHNVITYKTVNGTTILYMNDNFIYKVNICLFLKFYQ